MWRPRPANEEHSSPLLSLRYRLGYGAHPAVSSGADAATLGRLTSRVTFLPPRAVLAFIVHIPQPLALHPALIRIGTPVQDCRDFSNLDRAIEACPRVNASKNLAKRTRSIALSNRCSAYQLKGMTDKAIMDCDRAVGLDPANAEAFYNRGELDLLQVKGKTEPERIYTIVGRADERGAFAALAALNAEMLGALSRPRLAEVSGDDPTLPRARAGGGAGGILQSLC